MTDHIPDAGKMVPARCEPPEHLRGVDGWHWVVSDGKEVAVFWQSADCEWSYGNDDLHPEMVCQYGGVYHSPVATPAEVEAMRAEVMRAGAECADAMAQVATLRARVAELETALRAADQFVTNGIALGFIRMPSPSTPDPAHRTPGIIRAALEGKGRADPR